MNVRIIERLEALADQLELGEISLRDFGDQINGQITALENMKYSHIKEGQSVAYQLQQLAENEPVDVHAVGDWLRRWLASVPR